MLILPAFRFTHDDLLRKIHFAWKLSMQFIHVKGKEEMMRIEIIGKTLRLAGGQTLKVTDGIGSTLCCEAGTLWITEENRNRDLILEAGACMRLERAGLALVTALSPASLSIA